VRYVRASIAINFGKYLGSSTRLINSQEAFHLLISPPLIASSSALLICVERRKTFLQFFLTLNHYVGRVPTSPRVSDMAHGFSQCLKVHKEESFYEALLALKKRRYVHPSSRLAALTPFLDKGRWWSTQACPAPLLGPVTDHLGTESSPHTG